VSRLFGDIPRCSALAVGDDPTRPATDEPAAGHCPANAYSPQFAPSAVPVVVTVLIEISVVVAAGGPVTLTSSPAVADCVSAYAVTTPHYVMLRHAVREPEKLPLAVMMLVPLPVELPPIATSWPVSDSFDVDEPVEVPLNAPVT
jgi:hypothetical protein